MARPPALGELLGRADQLTKGLNSQVESLQSQFSQHTPFNTAETKSSLERNLKQVEDFIVQLTQSALTHLNDWNIALLQGEQDINETEGLLQRVKADTGATLVAGALCRQIVVEDEFVDSECRPTPLIQAPDFPYMMNMFAVTNVGHQVDDVLQSSGRLSPLILKASSGKDLPHFWSPPTDFFSPSRLGADKKSWTTSFSSTLGFDPVPPGFA